jgi:hypothetical protein
LITVGQPTIANEEKNGIRLERSKGTHYPIDITEIKWVHIDSC